MPQRGLLWLLETTGRCGIFKRASSARRTVCFLSSQTTPRRVPCASLSSFCSSSSSSLPSSLPSSSSPSPSPSSSSPSPSPSSPFPPSSSSLLSSSLSIRQLAERAGELAKDGAAVRVLGWVKSFRKQKHMTFVDVGDGTDFQGLQVVFPADVAEKFRGLLTLGTAIAISGRFVVRPETGSFDFQGSDLSIVGQCDQQTYPLQKKAQSVSFLRGVQHLRPRTVTFGAMLRIRSAAFLAFHSFFQKEGFLAIQTPVISPLDCEGAGELFRVESREEVKSEAGASSPLSDAFFGRPVYLTVSGQLYAEMVTNAHRHVYTFGPTFRAERSDTTHHLAEFWMLEPEMAFASLADVMDTCQRALQFVTREVLLKCKPDLEFLEHRAEAWQSGETETKSERALRKQQDSSPTISSRIQALLNADFARVTYEGALQLLSQHARELPLPVPTWGEDLRRAHELFLTERIFQRPVFVTHYPATLKPFYMRTSEPRVPGRETVDCMDLLVGGVGELVGGSQREERCHELKAKMESCKLNGADYEWYLDLRRFGSIPHSGFGLGFERYLQFLTGLRVQDLTLVPRAFGVAPF